MLFVNEAMSAASTLLFLNRPSTFLRSAKSSWSSPCFITVVQTVSHLFKEVKSSEHVRVEKVFFFLSRSPKNATKALEKSSWAQKFICPLPTSILVYLVKDTTSPCKPPYSKSQFLLNLWHENPNLPHMHFITLLTLTLLNTNYEASCSPVLTFL